MSETLSIVPYRPVPLPYFSWVMPFQKDSFDEESDIYMALNENRYWFGLQYEDGTTFEFSYDPSDQTYYTSGNILMTPYYDQKRIVKLAKDMVRSFDELAKPSPRKGLLGIF